MTYRVVLTKAAGRDIRRTAPEIRERIHSAVLDLEEDPRGQAEKLSGLQGYRKRVGNYRVIFDVDDSAREVWVTRVRHRRDAYRRR